MSAAEVFEKNSQFDNVVFDKEIDLNDTIKDAMFGFGFALILILGNIIAPKAIVIGFPTDPLTTATAIFLVQVIVAPFIEEMFFRGFLYTSLTGFLPIPFAVIIQAGAFSLFHLSIYGVGLEAAFIGVFLIGIVAWFISKYRKSLLPAIIIHASINLWLASNALAFIA